MIHTFIPLERRADWWILLVGHLLTEWLTDLSCWHFHFPGLPHRKQPTLKAILLHTHSIFFKLLFRPSTKPLHVCFLWQVALPVLLALNTNTTYRKINKQCNTWKNCYNGYCNIPKQISHINNNHQSSSCSMFAVLFRCSVRECVWNVHSLHKFTNLLAFWK